MSKDYKNPTTKKITKRDSRGRFRRTTLADIGILERDFDRAICLDCGYGTKKAWRPIINEAPCPNCKSIKKDDELLVDIEITELRNHWQSLPVEAREKFLNCFRYTNTSFPHPETLKKYQQELSELAYYKIREELYQMLSKGQEDQFYELLIEN